MKYKAVSKTGESVEVTDKREFNFGFFSHLTADCNKCNWKCRKGKVEFEGMSKGRRKGNSVCKQAKFEIEIVELEII